MSEELNKYIHTVIMGKCWHDSNLHPSILKEECKKGGKKLSGSWNGATTYPDYCSPDSPRRLLDEVVKAVVDEVGTLYATEFLYETAVGGQNYWPPEKNELLDLVTASPEEIATACRRAWEGEKG